jgi:hypothetical protein
MNLGETDKRLLGFAGKWGIRMQILATSHTNRSIESLGLVVRPGK